MSSSQTLLPFRLSLVLRLLFSPSNKMIETGVEPLLTRQSRLVTASRETSSTQTTEHITRQTDTLQGCVHDSQTKLSMRGCLGQVQMSRNGPSIFPAAPL